MPKQTTRSGTSATDYQQGENRTLQHEQTEAGVAKLAYHLWLQRGSPEGSPEEDWYRAENMLQTGTAVSATASAHRSS
jgi:hypothetical protein